MDNTPDITTAHKTDSAADFQEPQPHTSASPPRRRSSISKIVDAVKKPFHKEKKEDDLPPALRENIQKMEQRKESTLRGTEEQGKDTNGLERK